MKRFVTLLVLLVMLSMASVAQKVTPRVYYSDESGNVYEKDSIQDGQAPLVATFKANPSEMGDKQPSFEWHFYKMNSGEGRREIVVRYEEETQYTFMESGVYNIVLRTTLNDDNDVSELDSVTIIVTILESRLEFPNAFSPNGDGINDIYQAKEGYKSIISFHAIILNRWGQKLYEWDNPAGGWDGKFHGQDVKQGVYFVQVKAKGADGKDYLIRKDVNLLRGYTEKGNSTTTGGQ